MWGTFAAGLCATLASSTASPDEVRGQWIDSRSKVMIVSSSLVHTMLDIFKRMNFGPENALSRIIVYSDGENVQLPKGFRSPDTRISRLEDYFLRGSHLTVNCHTKRPFYVIPPVRPENQKALR
jgi:hypothetical protein